jgi:predicted Zn-dependent peptidase
MVFKGAGGRSAREIVEAIEAEGGQINAATGQVPHAAAAARLEGLDERFDRLPAEAEAVKAYVRGWA